MVSEASPIRLEKAKKRDDVERCRSDVLITTLRTTRLALRYEQGEPLAPILPGEGAGRRRGADSRNRTITISPSSKTRRSRARCSRRAEIDEPIPARTSEAAAKLSAFVMRLPAVRGRRSPERPPQSGTIRRGPVIGSGSEPFWRSTRPCLPHSGSRKVANCAPPTFAERLPLGDVSIRFRFSSGSRSPVACPAGFRSRRGRRWAIGAIL